MSVTLEAWQIGMGTALAVIIMLLVVTKFDLPDNQLNKMGIILFMLAVLYICAVFVNAVFYMFGCSL